MNPLLVVNAVLNTNSNMKIIIENKEENDKSTETEHNNRYIFHLFHYRNISWRYLLCYCLPSQKKILIKQLKIVHRRRRNSSILRMHTKMNAKKMYPVNRTKSLFDSILDLTGFQSNTTDIKPPTDSNYNKNTKHDEFEEEDDEEIPDFYHLPKIEVEELHKLFIDHRHKYQALHTLYITAHQEVNHIHKIPILSQ